jgi:hypothetical protein
MGIISTYSNHIKLDIAGISVGIYCNDTNLQKQIQSHYAAFLTGSETIVDLSIKVTGRDYPLDTNLSLPDGILHFDSPGIQGVIDCENKNGQLCLNVDRPFEAIDYGLRVTYSILAYRAGGILLHAAGIVKNGQAFLFTGHSGSGKTTIARASKEASVLNDDLVLVLKKENIWLGYGTPFWNPTQIRPNHGFAPLGGIYFLVQDDKVFLEVPGYGQALAEIISNIPVISTDPEFAMGVIQRGSELLKDIKSYRLHFLPDDSFWNLIFMDELNSKIGQMI